MRISIKIHEIFIKGAAYNIGCEITFDSTDYTFSFDLQNGKLQLNNNDYFMTVCAAEKATDIQKIETMIYHAIIKYLLEHERQYQWNRSPYKNLRQSLFQMMRKKHMTITDVSHKAGITEDEIKGILAGDTVTAVTFFKLCLVFDVYSKYITFQNSRVLEIDDTAGSL